MKWKLNERVICNKTGEPRARKRILRYRMTSSLRVQTKYFHEEGSSFVHHKHHRNIMKCNKSNVTGGIPFFWSFKHLRNSTTTEQFHNRKAFLRL